MFQRLKKQPIAAVIGIWIVLQVWSWMPNPLNPRYLLRYVLGPEAECMNGWYSWSDSVDVCSWSGGVRKYWYEN
jgi:hypothetical protein